MLVFECFFNACTQDDDLLTLSRMIVLTSLQLKIANTDWLIVSASCLFFPYTRRIISTIPHAQYNLACISVFLRFIYWFIKKNHYNSVLKRLNIQTCFTPDSYPSSRSARCSLNWCVRFCIYSPTIEWDFF